MAASNGTIINNSINPNDKQNDDLLKFEQKQVNILKRAVRGISTRMDFFKLLVEENKNKKPSNSSRPGIEEILENACMEISEWMKLLQLMLNNKKCQILAIVIRGMNTQIKLLKLMTDKSKAQNNILNVNHAKFGRILKNITLAVDNWMGLLQLAVTEADSEHLEIANESEQQSDSSDKNQNSFGQISFQYSSDQVSEFMINSSQIIDDQLTNTTSNDNTRWTTEKSSENTLSSEQSQAIISNINSEISNQSQSNILSTNQNLVSTEKTNESGSERNQSVLENGTQSRNEVTELIHNNNTDFTQNHPRPLNKSPQSIDEMGEYCLASSTLVSKSPNVDSTTVDNKANLRHLFRMNETRVSSMARKKNSVVIDLTRNPEKQNSKLMAIAEHSMHLLCDICGDLAETEEQLKKHTRKHEERKTLICYICNRQFKSLKQLRGHLSKHDPVEMFSCKVCCKVFKCAAELQAHFKIHYVKKSCRCHVCGKSFKPNAQFKDHMKIHKDSRNTVCLCNLSTNISIKEK